MKLSKQGLIGLKHSYTMRPITVRPRLALEALLHLWWPEYLSGHDQSHWSETVVKEARWQWKAHLGWTEVVGRGAEVAFSSTEVEGWWLAPGQEQVNGREGSL